MFPFRLIKFKIVKIKNNKKFIVVVVVVDVDFVEKRKSKTRQAFSRFLMRFSAVSLTWDFCE